MRVSDESHKADWNTLPNLSSGAQTHLPHARDITPTQVTPASGRSPSLTFLNRAI